MIMAALLSIGFASQTFAGDETTKAAGSKKAAGSTKTSTNTPGGKWTAAECNTNCDAAKCAENKAKFVECSDKCKATPIQILRCSAAGYKKHCMKPDMSENLKNKECERASYAMSAQMFRLMSLPVKSGATAEEKQAASAATEGRFKNTGKWLNHLSEDDLKKTEVIAIMSREAKAYRKVVSIDDENDAPAAAGGG